MKKKELETRFPYKLQFFAEDGEPGENLDNDGEGQDSHDDGTGQDDEPEITVESLMAELKAEKAARAKDKTALDNALKKVGDLTKTVRSMKSAEELEADAKREADENHKNYVKGLEDKLSLIESKSRYMDMGMDATLAEATAKAELEGDKDTVTSNIKKATEFIVKQKEAEWLKNRPAPQGGNGEESSAVTKDQFEKFGYAKRLEFKKNYPETYKKYTQ